MGISKPSGGGTDAYEQLIDVRIEMRQPRHIEDSPVRAAGAAIGALGNNDVSSGVAIGCARNIKCAVAGNNGIGDKSRAPGFGCARH